MQAFKTTVAFLALVAAAAAASIPPQSPFMGSISAPVPSTTLTVDTAFPFTYGVSNWCEEGYNQFRVFLTAGAAPPTYSDLAADGSVPGALYDFGKYAVANFGLPAPSNPAPSELTVPAISPGTILGGESTFLTVVQIFTSCPGHVVQELGVTSVQVEYASA